MIDEWLFPNRSTPPGSSRYYAVRFAAPARRNGLALLFGWQHELRDIPNRCSDAGVALSKLRWYREELSAGVDGTSQHPLIQGLGDLIREKGLDLSCFLAMTDATEADILAPCHQDTANLSDYCSLSGGSLLALIAQIGGGKDQALEVAQQLGAFVRLTEIIRDLGADLQKGRLYLPLAKLGDKGIPVDRLSDPQYSGPMQELLAELVQEARNWHATALRNIFPDGQAALGPVLGYAAIHYRLLGKLERANYPVLRQRLSLSPLGKLWIAWQTQRRSI